MKFLKLLLAISFVIPLSSCMGTEPNDLAYVVAVGFDKSDTDTDYKITIQFANPTQISGGSSEGGGKGGPSIVDDVVVEAPNIYAGINTANNTVSKQFSLFHTKLFVFSKEVAERGIGDLLETMSRSEEIRADVYMAVSNSTANEYLSQVKPVVELNPAKYYQLKYEENAADGFPRGTLQDFFFSASTDYSDAAVTVAGVMSDEKTDSKSGGQGKQSGQGEGEGSSGGQKKEKSEESSGQGGGEGGSGGQEKEKSEENSGQGGGEGGSGGQEKEKSEENSGQDEGEGGSGSQEKGKSEESGGENGGQSDDSNSQKSEKSENETIENLPDNKTGFEYKIKDYIAGEVAIQEENKSEIMGMAIFKDKKLVTMMGGIESVMYNLLKGNYHNSYITFKEKADSEKAVTVRMEQRRKPKIDIDKKNNKINIKLYLESDFYSVSSDYIIEKDIVKFEESARNDINSSCKKFIENVRDKYDADVIGLGFEARKEFLTNKDFEDYNWREHFKDYEINVDTQIKVRRTGLTIREG